MSPKCSFWNHVTDCVLSRPCRGYGDKGKSTVTLCDCPKTHLVLLCYHCVCARVHTCVSPHLCMHMWGPVVSGDVFLYHPPSSILRQVCFSETGWPASPRKSSCLSLPSPQCEDYRQMLLHTLPWTGVLYSGLHPCSAWVLYLLSHLAGIFTSHCPFTHLRNDGPDLTNLI